MNSLDNISDNSFDDEIIEVDNIIRNVREYEVITLEETVIDRKFDVIDILDDSNEEVLKDEVLKDEVNNLTQKSEFSENLNHDEPEDFVQEPPVTESLPSSSAYSAVGTAAVVEKHAALSVDVLKENLEELSEGEIVSDEAEDFAEAVTKDEAETVASTSTVSSRLVVLRSESEGEGENTGGDGAREGSTKLVGAKRERSQCSSRTSEKRRKRSSSGSSLSFSLSGASSVVKEDVSSENSSKSKRERSISRRRRERLIRHAQEGLSPRKCSDGSSSKPGRGRSPARRRGRRSTSRRKGATSTPSRRGGRSSSRKRGGRSPSGKRFGRSPSWRRVERSSSQLRRGRRFSPLRRRDGRSPSRRWGRSPSRGGRERSFSRKRRRTSSKKRNRSRSRSGRHIRTSSGLRIEEIPITSAIKEELLDIKIEAVKTPSPTQEFLLKENPLEPGRENTSFSRNSNKSSRAGSGLLNRIPSSKSRGSADSRENEMGLQPLQYKGSFLDMAQKLLEGTLVGQTDLTKSQAFSDYSVQEQQLTQGQEQPSQLDVRARSLLMRVEALLSSPEQQFSNVVILDIPGSPETTATISSNIHRDICDFLNHGPKSITCKNIPLVVKVGKQAKVKFYHKIQALAFISKYKGCYKSLHLNMTLADHVEDPNEKQDISRMSFTKYIPERTGMPHKPEVSSFLFSTITMETISSESVHAGQVTDPIKINFLSGSNSVTKNVMPLSLVQDPELHTKVGLKLDSGNLFLADKWIMNEESEAPKQFFDAMVGVFTQKLKQFNSESKFDEAVLVFKSWKDLGIFVKWAKLAEYDRILQNYVSYFGVINSGGKADLKKVYQELTNAKIESELHCEEENLLMHAILGERIKRVRSFCQDFLEKNCVSTETLFAKIDDCDERVVEESNVCIVSLEFINDEENYFLTQIGTCMFNTNTAGKLNKKLNFSVVLPEGSMMDNNLLNFDLGIARNVETGQLEFFHEQQKKKYPVVSEKEALLCLFSFVSSNQGISGTQVSTTTLFTYSSYSSLPVLLQAVKRNDLEQEFYQTFTSFTDFHMLASSSEASISSFMNGIPAISKLAESLRGVKCSTTQHPANGMSSLIYTLVEKVVKTGGQTVDLKTITKASKSSSCLKFSKVVVVKYPLTAVKDLKIFTGKKGEVAFDVHLHDVASDPNELIIVTNPEVSKDVVILSKVASYEKVSLVLKNPSKKYFSLEKGVLFGHLIPKPLPLEIPKVLPHLDGKLNLSKHSTTEAVLSEVEEPPPKPASNQKAKNPNSLQQPVVNNKVCKKIEKEKEPGSPGKTSFIKPINGFSFGMTEFDEGPNFQKTILSSLHMREFNLFAIAMECIELKNIQTLEPVKISLRSLHRSKDPVTLYIKPWDHSSYPEAHALCPSCRTYGLHFPDSCPAKGSCTACPGKHLRRNCPSSCCWNCLNSHEWKKCPKPTLTGMQKKLERLGFRFHNIDGKAVVKYLDVDNIEYNCYSKGSAMRRLMDSFDKSSTVLVGYNIATILDLLYRETEKSNHNNNLKRKIYAMIDVKWLFPEEFKKKPLKDLFKLCFKENCLSKTNTQAITEAIEQMIRWKVDLERFKTATSFVTDFGIRFNQEMLAALTVADYKPEHVLFNLDPKLQSSPRKEKNKELTFASECYSRYISKPIMNMNPKFLSLEKVASARLISISIKTLVVSGKNQLLNLSLYDVKDDSLISCMGTIPPQIVKMCPKENSYECRKCFNKPSFHFDEECPLLETCDLCLLVLELNHTKFECQNNDMCWNCGQAHNWKNCSKPLLTLQQKKVQNVGLDFEVINGKKTFIYQNGVEKVQCQRDIEVIKEFLKVLEVKDTVLIGYNITEILLDVFSCVLECPKIRFRLQKSIAGIVDIRWILGRMYRRSSLKALVTQILGSENEVDDSAKSAKQVANIVRKVCFDETAMVMRRSCFSLMFTPSLLLELLSQDINMDSDMFRSYKESAKVKHEVLVEEESNEHMEDTKNDVSLDEEIPGERLDVKNVNKTEVTTSNLVEEDEYGSSKHIEEMDELIVYIHLVVKSSEEIEVLEQIDVLIVRGGKKQRYSQMFDRKTQNSEQAAFFFSQLEKGLTCPAAKSITGVFLCPESFRIFGALLESLTGSHVKAIFTCWVSLVSELSSSSTVMTGISYQPGKLSTLYQDTFGKNLNPSNNVCEALNEIYEELGRRKDKKKMVKAVTLDNLVKEEYCIVLVHISVNWDAQTDSGVPQIESLAYQDLNNEEIVEHKALIYSGRTLWQEWRLRFEHKKVVLMSLQNDSTIPLLMANLTEHGGASMEEVENLVSGVCDFRSFMTKMGEEDFFSSFQSLETMQSAALLQLVTRILLGALGSSVNYDNFLLSFGHSLDSPYFNRQLLNSKLPVFSENLVSLVITRPCVVAPEDITTATVKVVSPRRIPQGCLVQILSSSLPFLELEVENLLNVSREFTVQVEMLNVEFEDVTIPESTEIAKGELVLKEDDVKEFKQKISVRTDLTSVIESNPELEEYAGPLQQMPAQPHHSTEQLEEDDDDISLLDEMTNNLLVTRLGFFRMDQ